MNTVRYPSPLGVRLTPIRLAPLVVVPAVLTLLTSHHLPLTTMDWILSMSSAVLFAFGGRWPVTIAVAQSALAAAVPFAMAPNSFMTPVFAGAALVEAAMRSRGRQPALIAASAWTVAMALTVGAAPGMMFSPANLLRLILLVAGPVLLGLHLRSLRELVERYHRQTIEAERRRATDAREARTEERMAIARELHDLVAHHIASMVLRVGVARHVVSGMDKRVAQVFDDVHDTGTSALADLRRLVGVLRDPSSVEVPLVEPGDVVTALDEVSERVRKAGHPLTATIDPDVSGLDAVCRLAVLRVVQEGLTNVLKHAGPAARVRLAVRMDAAETVWVEIEDDGAGRTHDTTPEAADRRGHGLIGMRERVELVGGELEAGPSDRGWRVQAVLPATAREANR
ncbi:sensor histidine kinase [Amycolatopsis marina]|uniref:sensor histidine kinase n=1 Tax=Amycolatopsis marina TaxID=490629 RepID=UPI0015A5E7F7|nr:histidine kinase [Amycolatopsis marina]